MVGGGVVLRPHTSRSNPRQPAFVAESARDAGGDLGVAADVAGDGWVRGTAIWCPVGWELGVDAAA